MKTNELRNIEQRATFQYSAQKPYAEVNWHKPLAQTSLQIKHTPDDTGMLVKFLPHRLFSAAILEKLCVCNICVYINKIE